MASILDNFNQEGRVVALAVSRIDLYRSVLFDLDAELKRHRFATGRIFDG